MSTGARRILFWWLAVLLILLAFVSPIASQADGLFSVHMARHIVLLLIVPALLLCGAPLGRLAIGRRLATCPTLTWIAGIGTMAFWHVPAIFNAAMRSPTLHVIEPASLLLAGTLYWSPILSGAMRPVPNAAAYLFTSCAACTAMGIAVTFAPPLYAMHAHVREQWGISASMDQQIGGLLMWVPCCLIYLVAIMAMFARWYSEEDTAAAEA